MSLPLYLPVALGVCSTNIRGQTFLLSGLSASSNAPVRPPPFALTERNKSHGQEVAATAPAAAGVDAKRRFSSAATQDARCFACAMELLERRSASTCCSSLSLFLILSFFSFFSFFFFFFFLS